MKKQKGATLVEVLVAVTVFAIISIAMFTSFLIMKKMVAKQKEYLEFEIICRDINHYSDKYYIVKEIKNDWDLNYFGDKARKDDNGDGVYEVYYDFDYCLSETEKAYCLEYYYTDQNELIISVYHNETKRIIIDKLNYGGKRYGP